MAIKHSTSIRFSTETLRQLPELIEYLGQNQTEVINLAVDRLHREMISRIHPKIILGWIEVHRGDLHNTGARCPECDQPLDRVFIAVTGAGRIIGPRCLDCATQE